MIHKNRKQASKPYDYEDVWVSKTSSISETFIVRIFDQENLSTTPVLVIVIISMLQTLAILVETSLITFPNTLHSLKAPVSATCNFILGRQVMDIEHITGYQIIALVIVVAYLLAGMTFTVLNFSNFMGMQRRFARVFQYWKIFIQIHFYCLFLPISNLLIELTVQAQNLSTSSFSGILTLVVIAEGINVILCLMYFLSNSSLRNNDPLALLNNGFLKYYCAERLFMSLITLLVYDTKVLEMSSLAINIINLIMAICHSLILFYTLPFYNNTVMKLFLLESRLILPFPVVNMIIDLAYNMDEKNNAKYAFFIIILILPLYFKFVLGWLQPTISQALTTALTHLSSTKVTCKLNTYWLIQSIYHLKGVLDTDFESPVTERFFLKSMLERQGYIKHLQEFIINNSIESDPPLDIKSNVSILVIKVLGLLRRKYPRNDLIGIIMADLMISDFNMIPDSYAMVQELSKANLPIHLRLSLMIVQTKIQRILNMNNQEDLAHLNLSTFFSSFIAWFKLKNYIVKQIEDSNEFYKNILDNKPDLLSIMNSGQRAQAYRKEIERLWKNIPEESAQSCCTVLLIYALYKTKVLFEYKEGTELFKKYSLFIKKKECTQYNSEINSTTILAAENTVFLINTDNKEFGNIAYCSNSTMEMFGDKPTNLIGKNVGVLMPPFLRNIHDILMMRKFESTESILKTTNIHSFGVDRQGFVFPVNVAISIYPWINKGLYFAGIVRKVQSKLGYMLMDENGYIDSYSSSLQQKLNLPFPSQEQRVHILELCGPTENKNQATFKMYVNSMLSTDHKSGLTSELTSYTSFDSRSVLSPELKKVGNFRASRGLPANLRRNALQKTGEKIAAMISEALPTQGTFAFYARQEKSLPNQTGKTRKRFGKPVTMNWTVNSKMYIGRMLRILVLQDSTSKTVAPQPDTPEISQKPQPRRSSFFNAQKLTAPDRFESESKVDSMGSGSSRNIDDCSEGVEEGVSADGQTNSRADILPSFERLMSTGSPLFPTSGIYEKQPVLQLRHKQRFGTIFSGERRSSVLSQLVFQRNQSEPFNHKKMSFESQANVFHTNMSTMQNQEKAIMGKESNRLDVYSETEPSLASPTRLLQPVNQFQTHDFMALSESNKITDEDPQAMAKIVAKSNLRSIKNFEVRENVKSLKYYKFLQAKFPMIMLIISLLVLLISSISMFSISNQTIPLIEDMFPALQNSLSRIYDLGEMNWYVATLLFFLMDVATYGSMIPPFQQLLYGSTQRFESANLQISSNAYLFGSTYKDFIFDNSIKLYTDDYSNHNSTANYVLLNSMEASNLLADHSVKLTQAVNFASPEVQDDIDFLTENMYNDLLSHLQQFSDLIIDEISSNLNSAESGSNAIFILVPVLFAMTIAVLIGVYTKSYIDTRKFLELFTLFKFNIIQDIQFQMNAYKDSLDVTLKDPELMRQLHYRNNVKEDRNVKGEKDKVIISKTLYFPIYRRAILMLFLLLAPIIVSTVSRDTFITNFESITPTLVGMIKPKEIIVQAILVMTQIGAYERNQNDIILNQNISDVLNENLANLTWIVSQSSLETASLDYYSLFHLDYCKFVDAEDYSTCAPLFNGVSTSGITGMILMLQEFLMGYKLAIETHTTNYALAAQMPNAFTMLRMANKAIDNVQSQSFSELITSLGSIEDTIVTFIEIGIMLCVIMSSLGTIYVYFPSIKERQNICKVLLMFPPGAILQNPRLKSYLRRESPEFQKVFQMLHQ